MKRDLLLSFSRLFKELDDEQMAGVLLLLERRPLEPVDLNDEEAVANRLKEMGVIVGSSLARSETEVGGLVTLPMARSETTNTS